MEHELMLYVFLVMGFLSIATAASLLFNLIKFPYTIGLVVIGLIVGLANLKLGVFSISSFELTPDIILFIILPILIFDAAINIDVKALRRNLVLIIVLAVFGLLISAIITGGIVAEFTPLAIGAALVFGALISATDPVAVIGLFNEIGAPKQLVTIVDGESIFNDATAIVLFTILISAISSGVQSGRSLLGSAVISFFVVLLGGLATGAITGFIGSMIMRVKKNNLTLQITLSLIVAYLSFAIADVLNVSGVMSTLAAGIVMRILIDGAIKQENNHYMENFWDYFTFIANSFVFLLLGLTEAHNFTSLKLLIPNLKYMIIAIVAVTVARMCVVYFLVPLYNKLNKKDKVSLSYQHIIFWGGLRGAVPIALVLAIPHTFEGRDLIVHLTLAYILFTLLFQGTTMQWLMSKLNIKSDKSYFDYHKGVGFNLTLPSYNLAELVVSQLVMTMEKEGFYAVENEEGVAFVSHLMRYKGKYMLVELNSDKIIITTEPDDITYGKQLIYETLLDLDNSVSSIREVVEPKKMQEIVKEVSSDNKNTTSVITKHLDKNLIITNLRENKKEGVIKELLSSAASKGYIRSYNEVLDAVLSREKSMSTGFEYGVAVPHARTNTVEKIVLIVGIKKDGVDFDSIDGNPSTLFFMIISPEGEAGPHIQLLAEISKLAKNRTKCSGLLNASTPEEVIAIIKKR